MSEQPIKKHLPTGDEPPRGYETLVKTVEENGIKVSFVMYSHLARSERAEIEALRSKSLDLVKNYTGLSNEPLSIEQEVCIIKDVPDTNKMFALVSLNKKLVGYSLIVIGWPKSHQWLIQHMIIDPDLRGQGIGTAIVNSVEQHAQESEVSADSILAVPVQESGRSFWQDMGYSVEAGRLPSMHTNVEHELIIYHKALE